MRPQAPGQIPRWIAQHARFADIYTDLVNTMLPLRLSTFDELRATISRAHLAARRLRDAVGERGARSSAEKIHWISVGLRAWRDGDGHAVRRALRAVPEIAGSDGALALGKARTLLASLVEHSLSEDGAGDVASGAG